MGWPCCFCSCHPQSERRGGIRRQRTAAPTILFSRKGRAFLGPIRIWLLDSKAIQRWATLVRARTSLTYGLCRASAQVYLQTLKFYSGPLRNYPNKKKHPNYDAGVAHPPSFTRSPSPNNLSAVSLDTPLLEATYPLLRDEIYIYGYDRRRVKHITYTTKHSCS